MLLWLGNATLSKQKYILLYGIITCGSPLMDATIPPEEVCSKKKVKQYNYHVMFQGYPGYPNGSAEYINTIFKKMFTWEISSAIHSLKYIFGYIHSDQNNIEYNSENCHRNTQIWIYNHRPYDNI